VVLCGVKLCCVVRCGLVWCGVLHSITVGMPQLFRLSASLSGCYSNSREVKLSGLPVACRLNNPRYTIIISSLLQGHFLYILLYIIIFISSQHFSSMCVVHASNKSVPSVESLPSGDSSSEEGALV